MAPQFRTALLCAALAGGLLAACGRDAAAPEDGAGLGIAQRTPAADATGVSVTGAVSVRFEGPVQFAAGSDVLQLERAGVSVPAVLTQPDSRTLLLTPVYVLDAGAAHTVRLGSGITHASGAVPPGSWSFTTAGAPPPVLEASRLLAHVAALAHDSMGGRLYGSPDELRAAGYIATEMQRAGLASLAGGPWLHTFTSGMFAGTSQNVIGVLPGAGTLADEWLVVGAHYDHVGRRNGLIHNGADDNASGTAGMLELGRALAAHAAADGFGAPARRSLMFVAFGAEEVWMVGSYHFCNAPTVPLASVAAMLNLDMIGRLRDGTLYFNGATNAGSWADAFQRHEPALTYASLKSINTDHRCFMERGRTAVALFTGIHPQYHTPEDDVQLIDAGGMATVANLALRVLIDLAVRP